MENSSSVVRFGDGEINMLSGNSIPFQEHNTELQNKLRKILGLGKSKDLIVCAPDIFSDLSQYNEPAQQFWSTHRHEFYNTYDNYITGKVYGNAFISRPYHIFKDKENTKDYFSLLKKIWDNRDILIIEGETSRSGIGNDLFENAKSINRIICPSKNAYERYDDILEAALKYGSNKLSLIMLGPTAKVIAFDMSRRGYQAIDIGHIDTEYEWFKMQATEKIKLLHKYTAEFNYDDGIEFLYDEDYEKEILLNLNDE